MSIEELDYIFHSMQAQQEGPVYLADLRGRGQGDQQQDRRA